MLLEGIFLSAVCKFIVTQPSAHREKHRCGAMPYCRVSVPKSVLSVYGYAPYLRAVSVDINRHHAVL